MQEVTVFVFHVVLKCEPGKHVAFRARESLIDHMLRGLFKPPRLGLSSLHLHSELCLISA